MLHWVGFYWVYPWVCCCHFLLQEFWSQNLAARKPLFGLDPFMRSRCPHSALRHFHGNSFYACFYLGSPATSSIFLSTRRPLEPKKFMDGPSWLHITACGVSPGSLAPR